MTKLTWNKSGTRIGRFHFDIAAGRRYKDGTYQYMVYCWYLGQDSSKEIITLGKTRVKTDEEARLFAETLISEIIPA